MKTTPQLLSDNDQIELKRAVGSAGFDLLKRVVAATRDELAVSAVEDQLTSERFPKRAMDALTKMEQASRLQVFLEVIREFETKLESGSPLTLTSVEVTDPRAIQI